MFSAPFLLSLMLGVPPHSLQLTAGEGARSWSKKTIQSLQKVQDNGLNAINCSLVNRRFRDFVWQACSLLLSSASPEDKECKQLLLALVNSE